MNKHKLILMISVFVIISISMLYANDGSISPQEAQKKLVAILQKTVPYRFSSDLKVGDKVEYKMKNNPKNKTDILLEVTKQENNGIWIVEKYDGNELYMLMDKNNNELLDFYAIDFKGRRHEPEFVSKELVETNYDKVKNLRSSFDNMTGIKNWEVSTETKPVNTKAGSIECKVLKPVFDKKTTKRIDNLDSKKHEEFLQVNKQYFSKKVPKMIPFEIFTTLVANLDILESLEGGFVENSVFELKSLNK